MADKQLLTHSRQQSFKACRKRHWWEYEIGFRRETDARALRMGSAYHEALNDLKHGIPAEEAIERIRTRYSVVPEGIESYDWAIEATTLECLTMGYEWRWQDQRLDVVASENAFRLPLVNPATRSASTVWDVAGVQDGIIRLEGGRLAVLEHKTTSDPIDQDGDYWRRLQLDSQISLYVWAARQEGHDVDTVLYDVTRKPTIRPEQVPLLDEDGNKIVLNAAGERVVTKQGKPRQTGDSGLGYVLQTRQMTPDEWSEKLMGDISARPEYYYARIEIARLDSDIQEMLAELWDIQHTLREAQKWSRWYKTVSRDSCSFCAFFGLCSSRFDPTDGSVPQGFVKVHNVHPELLEVS